MPPDWETQPLNAQLPVPGLDAQTIIGALSWWIENDDQPTKDNVAEGMTGKPLEAWFFEAENGEWYFNHERLKQRGVQKSLSAD